MIGEFLLLAALGILVLPVIALVFSVKALRAARRVEDRLDGLRGALRAGASTLRESAPPPVRETAGPSVDPRAVQRAVDLSPSPAVDPYGPPIAGSPAPGLPVGGPPEAKPPTPSPRPPLTTPPPIYVGDVEPEAPTAPPVLERPSIDWEKFTGVKLFSWIGGFALFLGAAFFAKYSMDHGWITPAMRVAFGFAAGTASLLVGLKLKDRFAVTAQTLVAAGAGILYTDAFAAHAFYGFIGPVETFVFLALVTVLTFFLSVRLDSRYIALLALVGGFLTPPILSTGVDRALGLFAYVTLLDLGLLAVVLSRGWGFLWGLAAFGTAVMQWGWADHFLVVEKLPVAAAVFLWFPILFVAARFVAERRGMDLAPLRHAAGLLALLSVLFGGNTLDRFGAQPALPFLIILVADALTAALAVRGGSGSRYHLAAGILAYLTLFGWTSSRLTAETFPMILGVVLIFGALHGALAVVLNRRGAPKDVVILGNLFPVALLLPLAMSLMKEFGSPALLWPVLFGLNAVAILVALATGFLWGVAAALGFTFLTVLVWIDRLTVDGMGGFLTVVAGMAALFFGVGYFLLHRSKKTAESGEAVSENQTRWSWPAGANVALPAFSAFLPFLLLAAAAHRLRPADPSSLFGLGLLLLILLLGLVRRGGKSLEILAPVALGCVALLEYAWHGSSFTVDRSLPALYWYGGFFALFLLLPFVAPGSFGALSAPWWAAALSGPVHGLLFYRTALALGYAPVIGALPAGGAVIYTVGLMGFLKRVPAEDPRRKDLLAVLGAVALLFVSLIFPLQFDKQWITLGWALEGVALLWFYRRVSHPGLKGWALALLAIAFVRLAANPAVLHYHPRAASPLFNWYLYAYGVAAACQFIAARLWSPPDQKWSEVSLPGLLNALGVALLFLLMNIEIADFFSTGEALAFNLQGSLSQDLAYTLGWGGFGLALLLVGLSKESAAARWASFALLGVTIGKLFLHDVWRLTLLYRAAAFVGLAIVLILGSFLYQRHFQSRGGRS